MSNSKEVEKRNSADEIAGANEVAQRRGANETAQNNDASSESATTNSFSIHAQYIKDLSFENPKAPHSLILMDAPNTNVTVDVSTNKLDGDFYEVILHLRAISTNQAAPIFLIDLQYGGLFSIPAHTKDETADADQKNAKSAAKPNEESAADTISQEEYKKILYVHCASFLFPFVRSVVADITKDSGFPALLLAPIDFNDIYKQKK